MSAINLSIIIYSYYYRNDSPPIMLLIMMGATMLAIAIASASLTCYPLCCSSTKQQGALNNKPNQVPVSIICLCLCHKPTRITNQMSASVLLNADQIAELNLPTMKYMHAHPPTSVQVSLI